MLSQYTSYLANNLCEGSSRKLIAGWWYVSYRIVHCYGIPYYTVRYMLEGMLKCMQFCSRLVLTLYICIAFSANSHTILQVLYFGHDGDTDDHVLCRHGHASYIRRLCQFLVRPHAVHSQHWRYHDYAQVSQFHGGRLFHGKHCGHESTFFLALFGVSICVD
jgi:hypothetical protein